MRSIRILLSEWNYHQEVPASTSSITVAFVLRTAQVVLKSPTDELVGVPSATYRVYTFHISPLIFVVEMVSTSQDQSSVITTFGILIAIVAIVGTQLFGWEWGSGQLIPTIIGVVIAGIAVIVVARRVVD